MATHAHEEQSRWKDMLDHLDLLSERMNSMGVTQQEVKKQITETNLKVDLCTNEQRELAK